MLESIQMEITKAIVSDASSIMELIKECVSNMKIKGIFQWNEHYPNLEIVNADIQAGCAYITKSDTSCIATITLNEEQSPEYQEINWLKDNSKALVVHRLAIHPSHQNQGLAKRLMFFAEELAVREGYTSIRLDAYSANPFALRLYKKLGYQNLGQIYFPHRELPFVCMEKAL